MTFSPRTSHGTVYIPQLNKVFIFGGYDLNNVLGDLIAYDVHNGTWLTIGNEASQESFYRKLNSRRLASFFPLSTNFDFQKDPFDGIDDDDLFPPEQYPPTFPVKSRELSSSSKLGQIKEFVSGSRPDATLFELGSAFTNPPPLQLQNFTFAINPLNTVSVKLHDQENEGTFGTNRFEFHAPATVHALISKGKRSALHSTIKRAKNRRRKRIMGHRSKRMVPPGSEHPTYSA